MTRGVWFGDIIHRLKPKTFNDWNKFLKANKYFFFKNLDQFKQYERKQWIYYLKFSFWKLFKSETTAIDYFKNIKIELFTTDHKLDLIYSYDFYFYINGEINYLIVKHVLHNDFFSKHNLNNNVWVFDSNTLTLYSNSGVVVSNPLTNP